MWAADLTRDMSSAMSPNLNLRDRREKVARAVAEKNKAKEGKGGKGKGASKGAKGAKKGATNPQASNLTLGNPISINGKKVKTAKSRGNKAYCIYLNNVKGCNKESCTFEHNCNVVTVPGRICEALFPGPKHSGKIAPA